MHIVEKDGIKCVAYVRSFLQVYVDYYEYKNPLIIGNEVLFTDYFGKGGFDPFVDGYEDDSMMEENAAMDEVLAGPSYWSASGLVYNNKGSGTAKTIRCIRDAYDKKTGK